MHLTRRSGQRSPSRPPGTPPAAAEASTTPTRRSTCSPRHSAGSPTTRSSSEQAGPSTGTSSSGSTTTLGSTSHVLSVVKAMSARPSAHLRGLPYWRRRSHCRGWSTRSRELGGSGMERLGGRSKISRHRRADRRHGCSPARSRWTPGRTIRCPVPSHASASVTEPRYMLKGTTGPWNLLEDGYPAFGLARPHRQRTN